MKVACSLSGAKATSGSARVLYNQDLNACNTFEDPDRVVPRECSVNIDGAVVGLDLPPMSIVTAVLQLE
jgi:alpha-L-arabinofuranosidase